MLQDLSTGSFGPVRYIEFQRRLSDERTTPSGPSIDFSLDVHTTPSGSSIDFSLDVHTTPSGFSIDVSHKRELIKDIEKRCGRPLRSGARARCSVSRPSALVGLIHFRRHFAASVFYTATDMGTCRTNLFSTCCFQNQSIIHGNIRSNEPQETDLMRML